MDQLINDIRQKTLQHNQNNITRTIAYLDYYQHFPEIEWAFLASMVSRNAGWNMTDLKTHTYQNLLSSRMLDYLFMTYERANWFIFSDAFPQLLLYKHSVEQQKPLFHLLKYFYVSTFMIDEWMHFWFHQNQKRLRTALIINEQNLIQKPVIEEPFFKWRVFRNIPYVLQEKIHLNAVLFPTITGKLYGLSIKKFTKLTKRIETGKMLAAILFSDSLYEEFKDFALTVNPTGTRFEYEQFSGQKQIGAPSLEQSYPTIEHENNVRKDWYVHSGMKEKWWNNVSITPRPIGEHFYKKRNLLKRVANLREKISYMKNGG
ncbi:DUF2515 family protein [Salinibacillus xinjiangensis]|uniref:DUF2515 domain-containing protein n=1 Tax=Salinibacillus xinjiangensis TaxID=1229268 RepID=A0A6G1XBC1_9BACI|nr:DUF2515 family protein [Salinibacillus xinjiangensis]MRG88284.1 DUF2515 domain-containing protein [Salinibacillus xinjiangensis]